MGIDTGKDVVRRFFRALGEGRLDEAGELVAEGAHWWVQGSGEIPLSTVKTIWSQVFSSAPGADAMKIVSMTAEADRVAVEIVSDIKLADGRDYRNTFFILLIVRDGRIASVREYMDTAYVQKLFGVPAH